MRMLSRPTSLSFADGQIFVVKTKPNIEDHQQTDPTQQHNTQINTHITHIMVIQSLYIINKSGGLIYQTDFPLPANTPQGTANLNKLTANDYLVIAGTIHGIFAIASKLTPTAVKLTKTPPPSSNILPSYTNSGLRCVETTEFNLYVYQTITGIKFLLVTTPTGADLNYATDVAEAAMKGCYEVYADFVMKDPFYELGMPVRGKAFERRLWELIIGK